MRSGEFVCRSCAEDDDREGVWFDERMASGRECARCGKSFPLLARVELLPDGWASIHAPSSLPRPDKVIRLTQHAETLIDSHALVIVRIGNEREVGIRVSPHGKIEAWVHDDPYSDSGEPVARWEYDPFEVAPEVPK